jgi:uncharacterized protein DUF6364
VGNEISQKVLDTRKSISVSSAAMKQKFSLTIDDALIEKIKIQAVLDKRSVSDITEELYREYLDRQKKAKGKGPTK